MIQKFIISHISVEINNGNYYMDDNLAGTITLELLPFRIEDMDYELFMSSINHNKPIIIADSHYIDTVEPFKDEFEQFLMERYPEKVLANQQGFNKMFGN